MSEYEVNHHPDAITLDEYLDKELSDQEALEIGRHVRDCTMCRQYLEARSELFALIAVSEQAALVKDVSLEVLNALDEGRKRLLTGMLTLEALLALVLIFFFGSRIATGLSKLNAQMNLANSLVWTGEQLRWISSQVQTGLSAIDQLVNRVQVPGISEISPLQLTWMDMSVILTGIFFIWLLINRILIGNAGVDRSSLA